MSCDESTFVHLTERFNGKEVFLVGTTNMSTMLALRTKELIKEVRPQTVMVQATEEWYESTKTIKAHSQQEWNLYKGFLNRHFPYHSIKFWESSLKPLFKIRLWIYQWVFKLHFQIPSDYNFMTPGFEVKLALDEASRQEIDIEYLGVELNQDTWNRLKHETRFNVPEYFWKRYQYMHHQHWIEERKDNIATMMNCD